jgi:hypothetical protein
MGRARFEAMCRSWLGQIGTYSILGDFETQGLRRIRHAPLTAPCALDWAGEAGCGHPRRIEPVPFLSVMRPLVNFSEEVMIRFFSLMSSIVRIRIDVLTSSAPRAPRGRKGLKRTRRPRRKILRRTVRQAQFSPVLSAFLPRGSAHLPC